MTHQSELFDEIEAQSLRDKGMDIALNADRIQIWKAKAEYWLNDKTIYEPNTPTFTSDDLILAIGLPDEGQNRNNCVGALFSHWARQKRIVPTGRYLKSKRTSNHGAIVKEWRVV